MGRKAGYLPNNFMRNFLTFFLIFGLVYAHPVFAKARFSGKREMILEADVIAIVDVTHTYKFFSDQKARASTVRVMKGSTVEKFIFVVPSVYPSAVTSVKKGRYLVFLKLEKGRLEGFNWHFSYRPVRDSMVEWYKGEVDWGLEEKNLEEVISEINAVMETSDR